MLPALETALLSSTVLPAPASGEGQVPDWVHLLPAGQVVTFDGRGPYHVDDVESVVAASLADPRGLVIDENHATDIAAPQGREAPARGWIVGLEARDDGIWGKVEWTSSGRALLADRAYRGVSPVIAYDKTGRVRAILRASLVNRPNLRGLTALHQESDTVTDMEKIAEALGLGKDATADQIVGAIAKMKDKPAMQSELVQIGAALGVEGGDAAAILAAAKDAAKPSELTALQSEVATLTTQLNTLTEGTKRTAAEAYVDGEIKRGRMGLKPVRDRFVSLHMRDAAEAEALIGAMPILGASGAAVVPPVAKDGEVALQAEQATAAKLLGIPLEDYRKTLQSERAQEVN